MTAQRLFERLAWPAFGIFWTAMALGPALEMVAAGGTRVLLMPAVFLAAGFFILLFGLRTIVLVAHARSRSRQGPRHRAQYQGGFRPGGASQGLSWRGGAALNAKVERNKGSFPMPVLVPDHEDPERRIVLWSLLSSRRREQVGQDYADWFGLPVVEPFKHEAGASHTERATVSRG